MILFRSAAVCSLGNEDEEMCFRRIPVVRSPDTNQQGRPGKTGAPGPSGWFLKQK